MKKGLIGLFLGLALFAIAAQYGNIDCLGILKVNTIQKLDTGVGVYVESVYHASGVIGAPDDRPSIYANDLNVSGTVTGISASAIIQTCNGRLTLESGVPVSTSDQTAKTTLYFTPYNGNQIALYSGSAWAIHTLTEKSLDISGFTANKPYDIFIYDNSGTLTLEGVIWTNDTTRATALAIQDSVYVQNAATNKRYIGTIRITASTGECEDSTTKRFVWNYYNRVDRYAETGNSNASWSYTTAAKREYNNASGQTRAEIVLGLASKVNFTSNQHAATSSAVAWTYIMYDSTSSDSNSVTVKSFGTGGLTQNYILNSIKNLDAGYHYITQVEYGGTGVTVYGSGYGARVWFNN